MMAISNKIFLSILSLDSYNRGYNEGIEGLGSEGVSVGNASLSSQSSVLENSPELNAGFFAAVYDWNGSRVISYRGTDSAVELSWAADIWSGWTLGAGFPWASQAGLAIKFFQDIAKEFKERPETSAFDAIDNSGIILTGHSLGGGLAGFVSMISGATAVGFDHMPFGEGAMAAILSELGQRVGSMFDPELYTDPQFITTLMTNSGMHVPSYSDFTGYYVDGEVNAGLRDGSIAMSLGLILGAIGGIPFFQSLGASISDGQTGAESNITKHSLSTYQWDKPNDGVFGTPRHSQPLLTALMFAEDLTEWRSISNEVLTALHDGDLAEAIGFNSLSGHYNNVDKLLTAIAYSALDSGSSASSDYGYVFGNTGIRALFDDADALGAVVGANRQSAPLEHFLDAITKVIVQFAGLMALRKIDYHAYDAGSIYNPEKGIIDVLPDDPGADEPELLSLNLSQELWKLGTTENEAVEIFGLSDILDDLAWLDTVSLEDALQQLHGSNPLEKVDLLTFALGEEPFSGTFAHGSEDGITVFVGTGAADDITGTDENDVVFAGDSANPADAFSGQIGLIDGGGGDDILIGWAGIDHIIGGAGNDIIFGGAGDDEIWGDAQTPPEEDDWWSDTENDVVFAGSGDDKVYSYAGADVISLGDGDDEVYVKRPTDYESGYQRSVIWGGSGVDSFYFVGKVHALSITVSEINDELLLNLSTTALFSMINNGLEWPYDTIIINLEDKDKIYLNGNRVGTAIAVQNTEYSDTGFRLDFDDYQYSGSYDGYSYDYYRANSMTRVQRVELKDYYAMDGFESADVGEEDSVLVGNGLGIRVVAGSAGSLTMSGFSDGLAGISFVGNGIYGDIEETTTVQNVYGDGENVIEYRPWEHRARLISSEYQIVGDPEVTVELTGGWSRKPAGYGSFLPYSLRLSDFQYAWETGDAGDNQFDGKEAAQKFTGGSGFDTVDYSTSTGSIYVEMSREGQSGDALGDKYFSIEKIVGTAYADVLVGDSNDNAFSGNEGDDYLEGGAGDDILDGGAGADYIVGGIGGDIYLYRSGDGFDVIYDDSESLVEVDLLKLLDISASGVSLTAADENLEITVLATGDVITVVGQFSTDNQGRGIEQLHFAGGVSYSRADIALVINGEDPDTILGTSGNETLVGTSDDGNARGGLGDDLFHGARGSDTSIYLSGGGSSTPTASDFEADVIAFPTAHLAMESSVEVYSSHIVEPERDDGEVAHTAQIFSFAEFANLAASEDVISDIWFEPEPIGALV